MSFLSSLEGAVLPAIESVALGALTGGASLAVEGAMAGIMSSVGSEVIQQLGQQLGLPQSEIQLAQSAFQASSGNFGGAAQGIGSAVDNLQLLTGLGNFEAGAIQQTASQTANDISDQLLQMINNNQQQGANNSEGAASGGSGVTTSGAKGSAGASGTAGGGWLMAIAEALGKVGDQMLNQMDSLATQIGQMGTISSSNDANFSQLTSELQATAQQFSTMLNTIATVIKSAGDGESAMAQKG